jgi:LemA protein
MKKLIWLLIPVGIIAILLLWIMSGYNKLVVVDEQATAAWSQVENQLQRRSDLIPNLVATVKGYAAHEEEIFLAVAEARTRLAGAASPGEAAEANDQLTGALSRLLVIVENYPNLKADANFRQLQDELAGTENRIAVARKDYNETVRIFNTSIRRFPTSIIAGITGFDAKEYFEAEEGAEKVPEVNFE